MTTGEEFLSNAEGQCYVPNFPAPGENASFIWNTSTQHLELTDVGSHVRIPAPPDPLEGVYGIWNMRFRYTYPGCNYPPIYFELPIFPRTEPVNTTQEGLFVIAPNGQVAGSFPLQPDGPHAVSWVGAFSDKAALGTWFTANGCGGIWSAFKRGE